MSSVDDRSPEQREWDEAKDEAYQMLGGRICMSDETAEALTTALAEWKLGPRPVDPVRLPPLDDAQRDKLSHVMYGVLRLDSSQCSYILSRFPWSFEDVPVPVDERQVREQTIRDLADDRLDDLPRFFAVVGQPENGTVMPGVDGDPHMIPCVSVDDVREMLRRLGGGVS